MPSDSDPELGPDSGAVCPWGRGWVYWQGGLGALGPGPDPALNLRGRWHPLGPVPAQPGSAGGPARPWLPVTQSCHSGLAGRRQFHGASAGCKLEVALGPGCLRPCIFYLYTVLQCSVYLNYSIVLSGYCTAVFCILKLQYSVSTILFFAASCTDCSD